jgi:hypothetical protein
MVLLFYVPVACIRWLAIININTLTNTEAYLITEPILDYLFIIFDANFLIFSNRYLDSLFSGRITNAFIMNTRILPKGIIYIICKSRDSIDIKLMKIAHLTERD